MTSTQALELSWFTVPDEVKTLLKQASHCWGNSTEADQYVEQVLAIAPNNPDVLISTYRYFFYRNNSPKALEVAEKVVSLIREIEQLPEDWEAARSILASRKEERNIRLYLNAYSATGLLLAKLGHSEQALQIAMNVKEIDDRNEFGASVTFDILTHVDEEDE